MDVVFLDIEFIDWPVIDFTAFFQPKDVFCLKETRVVNGYNQIRWDNRPWKVPRSVPEGATVQLHIVPDSSRPELRIWYKDTLIQSISLAPRCSIQGDDTED